MAADDMRSAIPVAVSWPITADLEAYNGDEVDVHLPS
jgi:hypothetical protein